ncbi:preprotein translocase subunit SecE, partial [Candidatus Dependentiae bacterium]|nr:preprotein translocase subunit SecE [Candidatus Dependentiae bacterium]
LVFVNETKSEVKKITWPSRDELIGSVIIVCLLVVVFAAILGSMDGVFGYVIRNFIS